MRSHDEDDDLEIVLDERGGGLRTFALGVLVGAGAALLLAPRTGRETQREVMRALGGLRERGAGGTASSVGGWVGSTRGRVTGRLDDVRQAVDDGMGKVRGAVEEGRMAARQARGELRRRMDEARETYRAGRAGTAPVRLPSSATPQVVGPAAEAGSTAGRGAGDRAG